MKLLSILLIIITLLGCKTDSTNKCTFLENKVVIDTSMFGYEKQDIFYAFDYFNSQFSDSLPVVIEYDKDSNIVIKNQFKEDFIGYRFINIIVRPDLKIIAADFIDSDFGGIVENIILTLNKNPFFDTKELMGTYTLKLCHSYTEPDKGIKDSLYFTTFNGKFKMYSEETISKGHAWVLNQHEIDMGIKNEKNIYYTPDKFAEFILGEEEFRRRFFNITLDRSEVPNISALAVNITCIINEQGKIDPESIEFSEKLLKNVQERLKKEFLNIGDWIPAQYKCKSVRTQFHMPILIK